MRGTESSSPSSSAASSAASMFSSSVSIAIRGGRSVLRIRRNQVVSMESSQDNELHELDLFETHVADRLLSLSEDPDDVSETAILEEPREKRKTHHQFLLSITFLRHLMDLFLCCDEEFRALLSLFLSQNPTAITKVDRAVSEHLDRSIKSLDICNAVTQSLDSLCYSQKHAAIAADALLAQKPVGEGQFNRSRSALSKLLVAISERPSERAWSFGRSSRGSATPWCPQRTLSLSVSKNWSGAKQLQAMAANLHPPRGGEGSALALAVYTMSSIQVFVMWVLVAAFPSQERCPAPGLPAPPRQLPWAGVVASLQERVVEEWKKKERKGASALMPSGMLAELQELERCGNRLVELGEAVKFPMEDDQAKEITAEAKEMAEVCRTVDEEAGGLQRKVREVFHRIVRSRAEVVEFAVEGSRASASPG